MQTIRELRQSRGWTQQDLAVKLGVTVTTISSWERGASMPQVPQLRRLARLFAVPSDDIVLLDRPEARRRRA